MAGWDVVGPSHPAMPMNKSKNLGTAAESAVVKACHRAAYLDADRRVLKGSGDCGDVLVTKGVIAEVKGGKQTTTIGPAQLAAWMDETEVERQNSGAKVAFLVTKKKGVGPQNAERWDAWMPLWQLVSLTGFSWSLRRASDCSHVVVRLELGDVLKLLRTAGFS